jgi:LmbE family N-acetylglucosaminyl deacetylase
MLKRIATISITLIGLAVLASLGAIIYLRSYFSVAEARPVGSVVAEAGAGRVLGVFAHPDDEQLVTGLFSAAKQADGAFTAMITGTQGEAGKQSPVVARQRDLGAVRKAEALKSGFALGLDEQEVWGYPDGGVPSLSLDSIIADISAGIQRYQPDMIVTFWPASGATGHADHMRMGLAAEKAVAAVRRSLSSASGYRGPRWIAYVITPPHGLRSFGGEIGAFVAANQPVATHAMPGNISAKLRGWKIHASQEHFVQAAYGFPDWFLYLLWDQEYYFLVDLDAQKAPSP